MILGVDFDNTIVCYDPLFHQLARERDWIPATVPAQKEAVRDYLRAAGREDDWTELQGLAYGGRISEAQPFPGVHRFFELCRQREVPWFVISHKTQWPVRGPRVDLPQAARGWLATQGFHDPQGIGLPESCVFFDETKEGKLQRISGCGCTHFIDDLPEFLQLPDFPRGVEPLLFDPWSRRATGLPFLSLGGWDAAREWLMEVA